MPPAIEETESTRPAKDRILAYFRATAFASFIFAIGAILMESYFWWFVSFTYVALAATLADSAFEKALGRFRYVMVGLLSLALLVFTFGFVWPKTKPIISSDWTPGNYEAGSDIHGLKWQDAWSDLRLTITNNSDVDLKDVDIEFTIEEAVADIKHIDSLPCSIISGMSILDIRTSDANGRQQQMPIAASTHPYRLLCDKIPAHVGVDIIAAVTNPDALVEKVQANFKKDKQKPLWVNIHATYKARMRPYILDFQIVPTQS